jgi:CheY-like chemotaxis protein
MRALTILVVDDDALVLQSTAAMLADLGHRVLEAGSGREALSILVAPTRWIW